MVANHPIDLLKRFPLLKRVLKSRLFQPALMLITLFVFTLAILAGLVGTPVGNRNFGIVFVWIVWWALLIIGIVPFLGRFWCTICPIPAPGEWLQRRGIVQRVPGDLHTLGKRWPRRLKNMWLQNFGFLGVAVFSTIILTRPAVSGWVLLGFLLTGVILSALTKNRVFCRYVCPVGGFIGLYSLVAPVELRVTDPNVCLSHKTKDCVTGNERGYGCPWMVYPGNLTRNINCGLCFECLKTCPHDNIALNIRAFGADLTPPAQETHLDEAYKAFIMLGSALLYSAVLLGPWGWLKNWANMDTLPHWAAYAAAFLLAILILLPGLFAGAALISRTLLRQTVPLRRLFVDYAYALIPLGLAGWIAFSFGFVLVNGSYALSVISDPFGWGWNLFGTANASWQPIGDSIILFLQVGILITGLLFAMNTTFKVTHQHSAVPAFAFRAALPITGFLMIITFAFLRLYLG